MWRYRLLVMQWSSRSAGVRPSRIMQYTVRSFVISLAIVLATPPSHGFTIRRLGPLAPTSDIETGESSLLEVRYDIQSSKSPLTSKADSEVITMKESNATATTAKITNYSYIDLVTNSSELPNIKITEKDLNEPNSTILEPVANGSTTLEFLFKMGSTNILDTNFTSPLPLKMLNTQASESELFTTEIASERYMNYSNQTSDNNSNTVSSTKIASKMNGFMTVTHNDGQNRATENMDNLMSEANTAMGYTFTAVSDNDRVLNSTEVIHTTQEPTSRKFSLEVTNQPVGETVLQPALNNPVSDFTTSTDSSFVNSQTSILNEESFKVTMIDFTTDSNDGYLENNPPTTIEVPELKTLNTEIVKEEPVTLILPTLKTYEIIESKPTSTAIIEETTLSNVTRSDNARLSLEKVMNNTPIPSLMELKNDLISVHEYTTRVYENEINANSPSTLETTTTPNISQEVNLQTEKIEIISSKRAGYLDNTETTSSKLEEATTENYKNTSYTKDTETFGSIYETEGVEGEVSDALEAKNVTGLESQSQLVEDAIKEELLMEKMLNENEYLKEKALQIDVKPVLAITTPVLDIKPTMYEAVTEDVLSVQPINIEKKQSVALYSVSPNYKPPKKVDIQPTKQFVRDPDDNTWRNERISSLGIVFKPKNASKSFTEVLRNKTIELSNWSEKKDKNEIPDLRIRLEKIAEVRKSKKKKINAFGDIVYGDSEESSIDNANLSREEATTPMSSQQKSNLTAVTSSPPSSAITDAEVINYIQKENFKMFKEEFATPATTFKNKLYRLGELYDSVDDYDADYVTKIDLKKFTTSPKTVTFKPSPRDFILNTKNLIPVTYMPNRQPTVQYFPPTKKMKTTAKPKVHVKVNIDDYDDSFKNKVNQFTYTEPPKTDYETSFGTASPAHTNKLHHSTSPYNNEDINKNLYLTSQPHVTERNKASYVIKHYKDFIADAVKGNDDDNLPFTVAPILGMTISDEKFSTQKELKRDEDYDYNTQFHKDIVSRFVDNFNQNSDRHKVDFPIIYNNSVIHRTLDDNGRVLASSRQSMKRLYDSASPRSNFLSNVKPCDANCESMRIVDLSPAYELHYYVPEQEEKEEIEPRENVLPYRYRL